MTDHRKVWALARKDLAAAVASVGFPEELADLLARQLKSPKAMDRMTSYIYQAQPKNMEAIADEMLAICAEIETWRQKKEGNAARESYNAWLSSETRWELNGRE